MKEYRVFASEPLKKIEKILLHKPISLAFAKIIEEMKNTGTLISKRDILDNLPLLIYKGLKIMRSKGQVNKQRYELLHGCILAVFLNAMEPEFNHDVCYPEDSSHDFQITKYPRNKEPDFKTINNKKIYKNVEVLKIDLAELTAIEDLGKIINSKSQYTKRILLISIAFNSQINFQEISNTAVETNKSNFETIWLMGQVEHPEDNNKLCYFIAELVKYKKIFPLFEVLVDWDKIKNEVDRVLNCCS